MVEIEMMPEPNGTWIMVCPCGQAERRGLGLRAWRKFKPTILPNHRYRVCCTACGRCMEHRLIYGITRSTK
ncbi:hypothetical protein [Halomonas tibetensis]|uniref:Uncharacterized protein n=1 Tax=Halomonas tibetensis TaxID=2259590 RepID=A0ABV7B9S6_9GAMM